MEEILKKLFRINLFEKDKNPKLSFSRLKYQYNYSSICSITDSLSNQETYNKFIYGIPFPSNFTQLGNTTISYQMNKVESEINWILLSIRKHKKDIILFLKYKEKYEKYLILGDYTKANEYLNKIEDEISLSLWGIENRFILIELQKGYKENAIYLGDITNFSRKKFIKYLASFYSSKAEKELSINQYDSNLLRSLLPLIQKGWDEDFEYFIFKLSPLSHSEYSHYSAILAYESYNSLIDKYLSLIRILKLILISGSNDEHDFVLNRLYYLSKKVNNKELLLLLTFYGNDEMFNKSINDEKIIQIFDLYTLGEYEKCELEIKKFLIEEPLVIELYSIYVKTLLLQKKELKNFAPKDSFQYEIIDALYALYSKIYDPKEIGIILKKIAYNLSSLPSISYQLNDIVLREVENSSKFKELAIINTSFINPLVTNLKKTTLSYNSLQKKFPNSFTISFFKNIHEGRGLIKRIPSYRQDYYTAINLEKQGLYSEALLIWENLMLLDLPDYLIEKFLVGLFDCAQILNDLDYCINIYLKYWFINKYITTKLSVDIVKDKIKIAKFKNVQHSIELPIFYYLTNSESHDTHIAYECYLLSQKAEKPSGLLKNIDSSNIYDMFFLKHICTPEIFKHFPFIESTHEKLTERINICNYLTKTDLENKEEYQKEGDSLSKQLIIQKGLQEIDESKIFVNKEYITQVELKEFKSIFNRYVMISQLKKDTDISVIDLYSDEMFKYSLQDERQNDSVVSKDPQYDIFKDLFYGIRDKYLFSKQGLRMYLSARIRHGVLVGELRPIFELQHLITEKEKGSDKYKFNLYWKRSLSPIIFERLNNILSLFSKEIDDIINIDLLSKFLLIKTEKENPEGWLDYVFEDVTLKLLYLSLAKCDDYDVFTEKVFDYLQERTKNCLWAIQKNIKGEIKNHFFELIQNTERECADIPISNELLNNLTDVRVKIENKLNKIANWFTIANTQISNFGFSKLIEVCCESMNSRYPAKEFILIKKVSVSKLVKGQYFSYFVDIITIFFQNILDYSDNGKVNASVLIKLDNSNIISKPSVKCIFYHNCFLFIFA